MSEVLGPLAIPYSIRAEIQDAILRPHRGGRRWTLQGFGMLRTYLGDAEEWRLHVWDSRFRVPGVTDVHDHPWDFASRVLAGVLVNRRFNVVPGRPTHWRTSIECGEDAHVVGEAEPVHLLTRSIEVYSASHERFRSYRQAADEIHVTESLDGTVSVVRRSFHEDRDHASVFVPDGEEWIDAIPRRASGDEIDEILTLACGRWREIKF